MALSDKSNRLLRHTGNPDQIFYAQRLRLAGDKADGLEAVDIDNGGGMRLLVLPGRGLDIGRLSWKGTNLSFLSKAGFAHPAFYDPAGMEGIATFAGGFLATCGLRNVGSPCESGGEAFGMHGRIGQSPAGEVAVEREILAERPWIRVSGAVREARLFGPHLELRRSIRVHFEEPRIEIEDRIRNLSGRPEPLMLLYHFNLGHPLLDESAEFLTSDRFEAPRDDNARAGLPRRRLFAEPREGEPEQCFYYAQRAAADGLAFAACVNDRMGTGVAIWSDPAELPLLTNWKTWAAGDYAMGIEPATCRVDGREAHRLRGELPEIPAYGEKRVSVRVDIVEREGIAALRRMAERD